MKSKASIKSHPLHPILVSFPIAFFVGTLLFDIAAQVNRDEHFEIIAMWLEIAGIGFALLAAIPGIIDYYAVVPPKSSAKKRATKHGLLNITMVIIFAIALWLRHNPEISHYLIIGIEAIGVILLSVAGWLGGTLVHRNQIGVDIRYANATKWSEQYIKESGGEILVAAPGELKINQMKLIHVAGKRIVICNTEKGHAAFDDHFPHRGGSLAAGALICGTVQCPWHGSQFDVHTGQMKAGPAKENISTYVTRVTEAGVLIVL